MNGARKNVQAQTSEDFEEYEEAPWLIETTVESRAEN